VSDEREGFWFTMFGLVALLFGVLLGAALQHAADEHDTQVARDCGALFARGDTVAALRWDRRCLDYLPEEALVRIPPPTCDASRDPAVPGIPTEPSPH
jgi:hypothetical protein